MGPPWGQGWGPRVAALVASRDGPQCIARGSADQPRGDTGGDGPAGGAGLEILDRVGQLTGAGGVDHLLGLRGHLDAQLVEALFGPAADLPRVFVRTWAGAGSGAPYCSITCASVLGVAKRERARAVRPLPQCSQSGRRAFCNDRWKASVRLPQAAQWYS